MTTIKTTCSRCGDVQLTPEELALELEPGRQTGSYKFVCPLCDGTERRPANARVVSILLATGVACEVLSPITEEEITAFAEMLDREPDLFRLLAS